MQNLPLGEGAHSRGTFCMYHVQKVSRPTPSRSNGRFCTPRRG
jgi:hypothetical protein